MSQSSTAQDGPRGGSGGKVNVQDISLTKYVDRSSPGLMKACCDCTPFKKAQLLVRKAGGNPLDYLIIDFEEVRVSSVSTGGSGGEDKLTENVSLNFKVVKVHYQPQGKDGAKEGGVVEMGWNIAENTSA
jgi:type VI secretion system secreted protein Hcp